jgi:hypothetical protein
VRGDEIVHPKFEQLALDDAVASHQDAVEPVDGIAVFHVSSLFSASAGNFGVFKAAANRIICSRYAGK